MLRLCQVYGTDLAVSQVEAATRSQATSPAWHTYRKGLVTASIGHTCFTKARTILRAKADVNVAPLLSLILRSNPVSTPAMRAGVEKEGPAKELYIEKLRAAGHEASIEEVGLLLLKDFPLVGCSPDGIVSFSCHCCKGRKVLLEVKCPGKLENAFSNFSKRQVKIEYITQVNVQMAVSGIYSTNFFVYVDKNTFCLRHIVFDAVKFEEFKETIHEVYERYVFNELLQRVKV